jgi:hypothetical protein
MVLFSGFIQPKSLIPKGWQWFYWMNPMAWALKAVSVNEYSAPKYDFLTCTTADCSTQERFGTNTLKAYGLPTDEKYIWYSFAIVIAFYLLFFFGTFLALKYLRVEPVPPPPLREDEPPSGKKLDQESTNPNVVSPSDIESGKVSYENDVQLPFEPLSLAFRNITYTVTLPSGEDIDLLRNVDGYFEPGTMTALMGSSGAGKTTLLDVLAGRKNTGKKFWSYGFICAKLNIPIVPSGVIQGDIHLNGIPKIDNYFRKVMAYVEQFDTLPQRSTVREAIEFSAALRLRDNVSM